MLVKSKIGKNNILVNVSWKECPTYQCFSPHEYQHKGRTIDGKDNGWTDKYYSCSHRNYHGCPDTPKLRGKHHE